MSEREAFEEWCRLNCSPRAESSDWYWRIFQAGAAWQRSTAAQPTAYCRYCGVPDGDGHTADCQHPSLASQPKPAHVHTDECWEPDSGCDMGRNEQYARLALPDVVAAVNAALASQPSGALARLEAAISGPHPPPPPCVKSPDDYYTGCAEYRNAIVRPALTGRPASDFVRAADNSSVSAAAEPPRST